MTWAFQVTSFPGGSCSAALFDHHCRRPEPRRRADVSHCGHHAACPRARNGSLLGLWPQRAGASTHRRSRPPLLRRGARCLQGSRWWRWIHRTAAGRIAMRVMAVQVEIHGRRCSGPPVRLLQPASRSRKLFAEAAWAAHVQLLEPGGVVVTGTVLDPAHVVPGRTAMRGSPFGEVGAGLDRRGDPLLQGDQLFVARGKCAGRGQGTPQVGRHFPWAIRREPRGSRAARRGLRVQEAAGLGSGGLREGDVGRSVLVNASSNGPSSGRSAL